MSTTSPDIMPAHSPERRVGSGLDGAILRPTVITSRADLATIREEWRRLHKSSVAPALNADADRFAATLDAMRGAADPYVVMFSDTQGPRALLVARTTRRRIARRLGYITVRGPSLACLEVVYGGTVTDGSIPARRAIVDHIAGVIRSGRAQHVMVNHVRADDPIRVDLEKIGATAASAEPHWVTEVTPGSFDQTMSGHSAKHRSNLRRLDRRLADEFQGALSLDVYTQPDEIPRFLELASGVARQTYQTGLDAGLVDATLWLQLLTADARLGRTRCFILAGAGRPIAYQIATLDGDRCYLEGTGYLPEYQRFGPGTVLFMRVLRDLCEQGMRIIDFGFGEADYKRLYGTASWQEVVLHLYGEGLRPVAARAIDSAIGRLAALAGHAARGAGAAGRLKRAWRSRLRRKA
jgi:CelD/BcsL family acetyltransferase involved in cellulose biosynthesis